MSVEDETIDKEGSKKQSSTNNPMIDGENDPSQPYAKYLHMEPHRNQAAVSSFVPEPCFYKNKVGRLYVCYAKKDADGDMKPVCMVGPCWPMVILVTCLIVGIPLGTSIFAASRNEDYLYVVPLVMIGVVLTLTFYYLTACSNPGIQKRGQTPEDNWFFDERLKTERSPNWQYDPETQMFVEKIDHFCPWTGTVIAKRNLKAFFLFNGFLWVLCFCGIALPLIFVAAL